jgi:Tfp pilus assembly protein PilX
VAFATHSRRPEEKAMDVRFTRIRHPRKDDGVALVVAIAVMGLVAVMILTMLVIVTRENRQTGNNRQRAVSVSTAEGAVDAAFASIQSQGVASIPCGSTTVTNTENPPEVQEITTVVTYLDKSGNTMPCPLPDDQIADTAIVKATSATKDSAGNTQAKRTVESAIRLKPTMAQGFNHALYGSSGIAMQGNLNLNGQPGKHDADIYTNGDFKCANGTNQVYEGSIFSQGLIDVTGSCVIKVKAHAKTGFKADGNGSVVNGNVVVSDGTANTDSKAHVGGTISAKAHSGGFCGANPSKCSTGNFAHPPYTPFPELKWPEARPAWEAALATEGGPYTLISPPEMNNCNMVKKDNGPGDWIRKQAKKLTSPTIVYTDCKVILGESQPHVEIGHNLLVLAKGGFEFKSATIESTNSTVRNLYMIQPYNAVATHPCTTTGITMDSSVAFAKTINELIYSPCTIDKNNKGTTYGQVYAGGYANLSNNSTMTFVPLPVFGVNAITNVVESYEIDVLYKRENVG